MNRKWTCSLAAPIVALLLLATIGFAQQPVFIDKEPLGREAHSAKFDPTSKRMILFGGTTGITSQVEHLSDVWYLTNANSTSTSVSWIQANIPGNVPATRCCHSAVYNHTLNKMIVFGGAGGFANPTYNDVWVLKNANGVTPSPILVHFFSIGIRTGESEIPTSELTATGASSAPVPVGSRSIRKLFRAIPGQKS